MIHARVILGNRAAGTGKSLKTEGSPGVDRNAELIFTGDELLRGDIVNTNQAYLGQRLLDLGIFAARAVSVSDDLGAIVATIREALGRRPEVLVLSGGLGPTEDDLTREATAEALGIPLEHHDDLLDEIRAKFAARGYRMGDSNRKQAQLPRGATAIPISGTAPGFFIEHQGTLVVALPGVPWELKEMWEGTIEPRLTASPGAGTGHAVRRIRVFGIGESMAAEKLADLPWRGSDVEIGTRASLEELTIILRGPATPEGGRQLDEVQARVCALLGERVIGVDGPDLPEITGRLLVERGLTVAVAESCTGGLVGKRFTDVPGSSDYFLGGVTAYSNSVKTDVLDVPAEALAQYGAVSTEVAAAMAEGVGRLLGSGCALSTTGVAGPGGGTEEKPVGLVLIGSVVRGVTEVEKLRLFGRRDQIRERAALSALDLLRRRLLR
jgi:competence/damage-inducible protein CinA-like protein